MMGQTLHILKKDVRYLRGEILLVLALMFVLAYAETHFPPAAIPLELLVVLALNFLIARVVHAEAIPGHNQFWVTRPYRWRSLLASKVLFVVLFVNLPILVAQIYVLVALQFSFTSSLPGLLWSQVLMIVCMSLPAMCLASLTSGLIPFMVTEFILVAEVLICEGVVHGRFSWNQFLPGAKPGPPEVEWVRDFIVMAIAIAFAAVVLYSQYRTRNSEAGRKRAVLGIALAAIAFLALPWPFLLSVQSTVSTERFDGSLLKVELDPIRTAKEIVTFPLRVLNIPANRDARADALNITLEAANGQKWNSGIIAPGMVEGEGTVIDGNLHIDPAFLQSTRAQPLTVHARLYLTLFGDPHSVTIPIQAEPVDALDNLQCNIGLFEQFYCRAIFRWPRRRVYAKVGENGIESYIRTLSYSPFPATLGFNPVEQHSFSSTPLAKQAFVTTKAPLSHFSIDATFTGHIPAAN